MKSAKIAINGFGRIGRIFLRQAFSAEGGSASGGDPHLDIVAINDLGDVENLAYLLKYDTVYGRYGKTVQVKNGNLSIDGKTIQFLQVKNPTELPWKTLDVDIALESTGIFESFESARAHLEAGAKRVILTAPAKDADGSDAKTILMGINHGELQKIKLSSNASCTTNAASPVIQIMAETVGVKKAVLNTVHGYTATQNIVDGPIHPAVGGARGKDFRRGRAAGQNIVPSTTGAAIAVTRAIKELEGRFDGIAMRVPVVSGSIADITFVSKKPTSVEEINKIFKGAASEPRWRGILAVTEDQIVSSDIIGEPYGAIVDLKFTKVIDGDLVKVLSWYDNEFGYAATLVQHVLSVASML